MFLLIFLWTFISSLRIKLKAVFFHLLRKKNLNSKERFNKIQHKEANVTCFLFICSFFGVWNQFPLQNGSFFYNKNFFHPYTYEYKFFVINMYRTYVWHGVYYYFLYFVTKHNIYIVVKTCFYTIIIFG